MEMQPSMDTMGNGSGPLIEIDHNSNRAFCNYIPAKEEVEFQVLNLDFSCR